MRHQTEAFGNDFVQARQKALKLASSPFQGMLLRIWDLK